MAGKKQAQTALCAELGGEPMPALGRLAEPELAALADAVRRARRRQQSLLASALEGALSHVPLLLRGPVRKILLP